MNLDRRNIKFRAGGVAGGLRLLTGTACRDTNPHVHWMFCDLPAGHEPTPHAARWWAEYGYPLRRLRAKRMVRR